MLYQVLGTSGSIRFNLKNFNFERQSFFFFDQLLKFKRVG